MPKTNEAPVQIKFNYNPISDDLKGEDGRISYSLFVSYLSGQLSNPFQLYAIKSGYDQSTRLTEPAWLRFIGDFLQANSASQEVVESPDHVAENFLAHVAKEPRYKGNEPGFDYYELDAHMVEALVSALYSSGIPRPSKKNLTLPTVHLGGTARTTLLDDITTVQGVLRETIEAMKSLAPHGRDYLEPFAINAATDEHRSRVNHLQAVLDELQQLAEHVAE